MDRKPFADFAPPVRPASKLRSAITAAYRRPEPECLAPLIEAATQSPQQQASVRETARALVVALRRKRRGNGVEALVQEYSLSSDEGVALMCLAEALLRIPDDATRAALIRDKLAEGDWKAHVGGGRSLFVNAATWGLVITGRLVESPDDRGLAAALTRLIARAGEPVIRRGVDLAMRMMGEQFVVGETIAQALKRGRTMEAKGFTYSYDMLGEAAATAEDAARYWRSYEAAIHAIGSASAGRGIYRGPGISIKLSALHPRYSRAQAGRVMDELLPRVRALALLARSYDVGFNIDAEEADRLELSLDLLESLALDPELAGWDGLGFVVQAYGKRCPAVIDWIVDLARRSQRRIMVRLVKGAYWDAEIKRAQVDGLVDFPVYTRKVHTDVAYIACARQLLAAQASVFPQFATHNAQTLATIHHLAGPGFAIGDYEFQCLHGMGEPLYEEVVGKNGLNRPCRIYAPVGSHETLLPYLVRRLLENGANSSFVHRLGDPAVPVEALIVDPVEVVRAMPAPGARHGGIALPADILLDRRNSAGIDLTDENALASLGAALAHSATLDWRSAPLIPGQQVERRRYAVRNPADHRDLIGLVAFAAERDVLLAVRIAANEGGSWSKTPTELRTACLERAADALQARMPVLLGLIVREAGKSLPNAIAEVREAIDFLRYYAQQARTLEGAGPLGPVVCISPWNFPLAIFTGQIAAALAAGNPVLAKPAEETPLIAAEAVRLLHEAGVPPEALQLVTGDGAIGAALVAAPEVMGVIFTGSTHVAHLIQTQLAERLSPEGEPIPLIAETGGQNAMIVDSSALTEQVVADVIASAFDSAGQRCSALRLLCLQEEISDTTLAKLRGALQELRIGATDHLAVDVGPVITAEAKTGIERHIETMRACGRAVHQVALPPECAEGTFVPPTIIELDTIADLTHEVFGPVLHVIRYRRDDIDAVIGAINATGYGLTFGLHSRLEQTVADVTARVKAGNQYINRNVIGAVVGVQPFGGRGLSGTGPKAGGPLYLQRLVHAPPGQAGSAATVDPAVAELADWLDSTGERPAAALARRIAGMVPDLRERELPGPVGERNLYALKPRGCILLKPASHDGLFHQLAAALATGNRVAIEADPALIDLLAPAPARVRARIQPTTDHIAGALIEGNDEQIRQALRELAARPGALVLAQAASPLRQKEAGAYRLHWLLEEVSISINTTASGGNASLLAMT